MAVKDGVHIRFYPSYNALDENEVKDSIVLNMTREELLIKLGLTNVESEYVLAYIELENVKIGDINGERQK